MTAAPTPIAVLGGTFDPVHYGHLRFADDVRRALGARRSAPGARRPILHTATVRRRRPPIDWRCCELAVAEFPGLVVDDRELRRAGKSYTVLTLQELRGEFPGSPILVLLGADAFRGLPSWHRWRELFDLAHFVVVERPGVNLEAGLPAPLLADLARQAGRRSGNPAFAPGGRHLRPAHRARRCLGHFDQGSRRAWGEYRHEMARFAPARRFGLY